MQLCKMCLTVSRNVVCSLTTQLTKHAIWLKPDLLIHECVVFPSHVCVCVCVCVCVRARVCVCKILHCDHLK